MVKKVMVLRFVIMSLPLKRRLIKVLVMLLEPYFNWGKKISKMVKFGIFQVSATVDLC